MYRPDAPASSAPALLTEPPIVTLSTDDEPTVDNDGGSLEVGQVWKHEDTGEMRYYTAAGTWATVTTQQADLLRLDLLFEIRDWFTQSE